MANFEQIECDWDFLHHLYEIGRERAEAWLNINVDRNWCGDDDQTKFCKGLENWDTPIEAYLVAVECDSDKIIVSGQTP